MNFFSELWQWLGVDAAAAVGVALSAVVLYLVFTVVLRTWGQRLYANRSGTGLAVVLVLGAIIGRSMLGPEATLVGGLIVLVTLLLLEAFFGSGRRSGLIGHRSAIVIFSHGEIDRDLLRRFHLNERVIWTRLRQAGVTHLDDVAGIVLETDGNLSILKSGVAVDPRLLTNVRGAEKLLPTD